MGFFGSFMGTDQKHDLQNGARDATNILNNGAATANANLAQGFQGAQQQTAKGLKSVGQGQQQARTDINAGTDNALTALSPYQQSGTQANTLYGNALGLNGADAQRSFGANYAASDPFRAQNQQFATDATLQSLNARGLSGSGYAVAQVADQNLRRGSQDYENYLNRLQGQQGQGFQAAGAQAGYQANRGNALSDISTNAANARAGIYGQRAGIQTGYGDATSNLNYGNAQQLAGVRTGLANGVAATRSVGVNNLMGLAGLGVQAYTGFNNLPKTRA